MDIRVMYSLLTRMPLLQGINGMELARIEERTHMQIESMPIAKIPFVQQGQHCRELFFLVSGTISRETISREGTYLTREDLEGPAVIEADKLFGLHCQYGSSYQTVAECQVIRVEKQNVVAHLLKNDIFRTNYINMLSAELYRQGRAAESQKLLTAEAKMKHFISRLFTTATGEKYLQIKMTDLAQFVGETRLTVSNILNNWSSQGLVNLKRKEIIIPDISKLKREE